MLQYTGSKRGRYDRATEQQQHIKEFLHLPAHTLIKDVNLQSFHFDSSSKPLKKEQNGMEERKQSSLALTSGQK